MLLFTLDKQKEGLVIPETFKSQLLALTKNSSLLTVVKKSGGHTTGTFVDHDEHQIHIKVGPVVCSYQWEGVQNLLKFTPR